MFRKLFFCVCCALVLTVVGANVASGDTVWEGKITDSQDCVEQSNPSPTGSMDFGSSDLEFMDDGGIQTIGLRFNRVMVPAGASISNAYATVWQEEVQSGTAYAVIHGELAANAAAFASTPGNISKRPKTAAVVKWDLGDWPTDNTPHDTPDISKIIEEIVGQSGWAEGSSIVLIFDQDPDIASTGHRTTHKAATAGYEPTLHIEWSLGDAASPVPANELTEVSIDTDLGWAPGIYAAASNGNTLYLSENIDNVTNGVGGITLTPSTYDPGRLKYGTQYFWRVRSNNAPPTGGTNPGRVWSFTTEYYSYPIDSGRITATASSVGQVIYGPENTINGSGLNNNDGHSKKAEDMWLSAIEPTAWIQYEFDKVYKLHEMWVWNGNQDLEFILGFGLRDVAVECSTDGVDWTPLAGVPEFAQAPAPATDDYKHNTTVDFAGAAAKYVKLTANDNWGTVLDQFNLSEVRFFYIPVGAIDPSPVSGASDVSVDAVLGWRKGREAVTHNVSISTDEQAVIDGTAAVNAVATTSYTPPDLAFSSDYFWKVEEVNNAETPSSWDSDIWSFTTSDRFIVEDFEAYNNIDDLTDPASNRIFEGWPDGYGIQTNGALIGNDTPPYAGTATVHSGSQAMPMFYNNTGGATYSEATHAIVPAQNWTKHGIRTLQLFFHGTPGNTGQLYVKINGTRISYDGEAANIGRAGWQPWNIDLTSAGLNLQSVSSLAVGVSGTGATGTVHFDDITVHAYDRQFITPVQPANTGLIGNWTFEGNLQDSSGLANHGTGGGAPIFSPGKTGQALELRGSDYVMINGLANDLTANTFTVTAWIKTTQTDDGNVLASNDDASGHQFIIGVDGGRFLVEANSAGTHGPVINDNQWHFITYVRDDTIAYAYVDGFLVGTETPSGNPAGQTRWSIGQEWDAAGTTNPSDFYTGLVDELRVYKRVLSHAEIAGAAGRTTAFEQPL